MTTDEQKDENNRIKEKLQKSFDAIVETIDPGPHIANKLFTDGVITIEELNDIKSLDNAGKRAEKLLYILFKTQHPLTFISFRDALLSSGEYNWILELIDEKPPAVNTVMRAAEQCKVRLRSYSYENNSSQAFGYIEVNGEKCIQGNIADNSLTGTSFRGVNIMELDVNTRRASNWKWFDTCEWPPSFYGNNPKCHGNTSEFIEYFTRQVSRGTVLLGITMDDPMGKLSPAFGMLKEAGVDVSDLKQRAMFAFVVQKGFPEKTLLLKSDPQSEAITLSVTISDTVSASGSRTIHFERD